MKKYNFTMYASFVGYVVQALVINYAPLLFVTFTKSFNITLKDISALIVVNFFAQLMMDLLATVILDKLGYRKSAVISQILATMGIGFMSFLPDLTKEPMVGLMICMVLSGMGGGIVEVIISPIVEALPTKSKSASMSLLHSFYSWGQLVIVLLSTLFFRFIGIESWRILSLLWALIPLFNGIAFLFVPIVPLIKEGEKGLTVKELLTKRVFWIFLFAMLAGGAAEQAVIQWTSAYAEKVLSFDKNVGDVLGPALFAFLMGTSRVIYTVFRNKIKLLKYMIASVILLLAAFLMAALCKNPYASLLGCALSGFAVGIIWPGMLSLTSRYIKNGGTAQFSLLAFFGDIGCIMGPGLVGWISDLTGGNIRIGFLTSAIFPVIILVTLIIISFLKKEKVYEKES